MKLLFFLLFLTVSKSLSQQYSCPSKEDIKPCTCSTGTLPKPVIFCNGLSSIEQLLRATKGMENSKFSDFFLEKSNLSALPSDIFRDIEIQNLELSFTKLNALSESLNRPPFLGLEYSLESLKITKAFTNDTAPLMRLSLSHLKKLKTLYLIGNTLPVIGNDWFESGPYNLWELHLLDTSTKNIGSHAFNALQELRTFRLTGGHITDVTRDMFSSPAYHLERLDFSNNRIASLPDNIFSKMPSLQKIYLENNALTTISEVVFAQTWSQLSTLSLYGNPLKCDKDIRWIYKYRMPEYIQGNCAAPENLIGRTLVTLSLADFD
ncbi:hypothetical protein JTE90_021867 [Oedothorax gibbosus]|uniref:Uncharacterized protein n=1 Tax=Oedothorax gibbosus TaxID=931172 RepID=A0AAV6UYR9_9ARAC|nr:hypothetical protein JTE90_021867 [Oedothorax gibbosus]